MQVEYPKLFAVLKKEREIDALINEAYDKTADK